MKHFVKPLSASVAALVMAAASFAPVANAEVSASAGVANMYLWRGQDLGDGSPAVFGDLKYSIGGAYVAVWGSSGDSTLGQEYDFIAGYGGSVGDFRYDINVTNYNYSDAGLTAGAFNTDDDTFSELTEVILTLGYGPVTFSYFNNVAGNTGYEYYTLTGVLGQFSAKLGFADQTPADSDYYHLDLTYAYNERLSFTFSKIIDDDSEGVSLFDDESGEFIGKSKGLDDDLQFVLTYSLPITL